MPKFSFVSTLMMAIDMICWSASFLLIYQFIYNIVILMTI